MPDHESRPPRLNGRYVVTRVIGKGAQARVYLAHDTRLRQWRAIKVLAAQFLDDDHVRGRFQLEAEAMARLSHANLLRVVDVDQAGKAPFMVMELARGGSVVDWMKRNGKVPPRRAVRIAQQCCDGLGHSHALGIVHRDIKPHNLLIKDDGACVITDFGIAHVDDTDGLTQTGSIMGTFVFMAPEQRSDAKAVDARADVYSLGATLFTMLTTRTSAELFIADSRDALLEGVPEALRSVVLRACRYDREERYPTTAELRQALEQQLEALPPDPEGAGMPDVLLAVPDKIPAALEPNSGVDDLYKVLAAGGDDATTLEPRTATRSPASVPPPSSTYDEASTVLPYQMPTFAQEQLERAQRRRSRSLDDEPSEDAVPDYIDQSTLDQRPEQLPREISVPPTPPPAPRSPTAKPAPVVALPPPPPPEPVEPPAGRTSWVWAASGGILATVGIALAIGGAAGLVGIRAKSEASAIVSSTASTLVRAVEEQDGILRDLTIAGAEEQLVREKWFRFRDGTGQERTIAAAEFAEIAVAEANRVQAPNLVVTQAAYLDRVREDWVEAKEQLERVRNSPLARLTGDLGI